MGHASGRNTPRWAAGAAVACVAAALVTGLLARVARLPAEPLSELVWLLACQWLAIVALRSRARRRPQALLALACAVPLGAATGLGLDVAVDGVLDVGRRFIILDGLLALCAVLALDVLLRRSEREQVPAGFGEDGSLIDVEQAFYGGAGSLRLYSLYHYRELLRNLVAKDLKLKYRRSTLGFLWSLLNPLISISVYAFAFHYVLQDRRPNFTLFLMLGVLPWTFFASSLQASTGAILDNVALLKNALFPRAILPMAAVLFHLVQFLLSLVVLLPVALVAFGVPLDWPMLVFPGVVLLQCVFTLGVALVIATLTAFFHDVRHLVDVGVGILFWLTPILYDAWSLPPRVREWILLNPLTSFIVPYQQIFYHQRVPEPYLLISALAFASASLALGYSVFVAVEHRFMEQA